jgi:hypothetical protein
MDIYIGCKFLVRFMSKMAKIFTVWYVILFFCLGPFFSASSGREEIGLKFKGQIMSAELQGVSLRLILEKLKGEKGIWSKGDESLLDDKVSIRFKDLPLEEGLRRILSDFNHVLVFDREKGLVGLFVFGKRGSRRAVSQDEPPATEKGFPSGPLEEATVRRNPFEIFPDTGPPGSSKAKSTGTASGEDLPFSQDHQTEITDGTSMEPFPSIENPFTQGNPFAESISPSPESPFSENISPAPENPFTQGNPFTEKTSPSPENPFNEGISPAPEDPFFNPFVAPQ